MSNPVSNTLSSSRSQFSRSHFSDKDLEPLFFQQQALATAPSKAREREQVAQATEQLKVVVQELKLDSWMWEAPRHTQF
ncbi:hypothetical protein DUNSADRAFT_16612 [Dunaliella salina]|uniref:Encoded protein n=1 Tax=Dunaliella salina TaxID=3046 RepID=A0ABQ7G392_DUNSA|nr:hypothetical protein DUNSADRAFT_16612 [Dunaliella salina]|eukprot:KAF5829079.1 hypothetical protein DUNSADRAFT_16612 [Dunaliella salina]